MDMLYSTKSCCSDNAEALGYSSCQARRLATMLPTLDAVVAAASLPVASRYHSSMVIFTVSELSAIKFCHIMSIPVVSHVPFPKGLALNNERLASGSHPSSQSSPPQPNRVSF